MKKINKTKVQLEWETPVYKSQSQKLMCTTLQKHHNS